MSQLHHIIVTLFQAALLFSATYAVFILIPGVAVELRTKLWIKEDNKDMYFDKWDLIHWGSALLGVLAWTDQKRKKLAAYSGFFVATAFELYEQFYLCAAQKHQESCEPWQDTSKDILTAVLGIIVALFHPYIVTGLGLNETLFWTLTCVILIPHWWWYGLILFAAIVIFLNRMYKHPSWIRIFFVVNTILCVIIRVDQGTIAWTTLLSTLAALAGILLVVILVKALDQLRPSDISHEPQLQQNESNNHNNKKMKT